MRPAYVMAEVGVNHNGDLGLAKQLVEAAHEAGADCVKFQTFHAKSLATVTAPKTEYQTNSTPKNQSHFEMLRQLELSESAHFSLQERCEQLSIDFLSTPFDFESLDFLVTDMGLTTIKIGSGDTSNLPLLARVGAHGVNLILSTGMADLMEVREALGAFAFGAGVLGDVAPDPEVFAALTRRSDVHALLAERVQVLHCTSEYPTPPDHVNLAAMDTLGREFGLPVGLSDHTKGTLVAVAAVARGATIIEKHITLDRGLPGPDHSASLTPGDFRDMVNGIRLVESAIGSEIKTPSSESVANRAAAAKSLFAARDISAGVVIVAEDIVLLRPVAGALPRDYWRWLGQPAPRAYSAGDPIQP